MIVAMYISSTFLTLALYYSESPLCGAFISSAFACALGADFLWNKTKDKIKALEKALERSEGK